MVEKIKQTLADSPAARWTVLVMVSLTMMSGYFLTDALSPLQGLLEQKFGWSGSEFGFFFGGYGWLNVVLFMLIIGGIILDKKGPRFTGIFGVVVMLIGVLIKYYAIEFMPADVDIVIPIAGTFDSQVLTATVGYAIFAFGYETFGITANKIVVRWFRGKEMAFALGMNVGFARIGTFLAMAAPVPLVNWTGSMSAPIMVGLVLLGLGFLSFMVYFFMDKKLEKSVAQEQLGDDERFRLGDIFKIIKIKGFWYIAMMCMLFYAAILPFKKFAVNIVETKFGVDQELAGLIPALLPLASLLLTPIFGIIYDKKGKGVTLMILGTALLIVIYTVFSIPGLDNLYTAIAMVLLLGVAFALVPAAMWPSVAKIIPENQLGTAFALIFWVQSIGLSAVPLIIGNVLEKYGQTGMTTESGTSIYDYQLPMFIFAGLAITAIIFGFLLKREDRLKNYGLEKLK